jgi:branched-chain amino acid transport system ATP-binding protein
MSAHPMLSVQSVSSNFKGALKLSEVSLTVERGQLVSILGANGAGKSTLLGVIAGEFAPSAGRVLIDGEDVSGWPAHRVLKAGIALAPQNHPIFESMTVEENLALGPARAGDEIYDMFPNLRTKRAQRAGRLSGGERQMLSMAQALLAKPKLCMFDEPSSGLAPLIVHQVFEAIRRLADGGTTVLMVEQNARAALAMADYAYVMEQGRIALRGRAREISADDHVRRAYLGL